MDQDDAAARDVLAPLDPDQIASRLRDEEQLIANGGIEGLQYFDQGPPPPPKSFNFDLAECDSWNVQRTLGTYMGIQNWDDIPNDIPAEHFDGVTQWLEADARRKYEECHEDGHRS